jgi:hypothetical protein
MFELLRDSIEVVLAVNILNDGTNKLQEGNPRTIIISYSLSTQQQTSICELTLDFARSMISFWPRKALTLLSSEQMFLPRWQYLSSRILRNATRFFFSRRMRAGPPSMTGLGVRAGR